MSSPFPPVTAPFRHFPDVQSLLVFALESLFGAEHTGTETPASFDGMLPFARVLRAGGPSTWLNDHPTIDVDVFAALYDDAIRYSEIVREWLVGPPSGLFVVDRAECSIGPVERPWGDNTGVRRVGATYQLTLRRRLG